ncbi:MAG: helix-turn-helix transcriptional regulator [Oligoflexales bacterium]|nr:helix-turn-helix transcriptional regulator [Oligoflexales bacterium]
MVNNGKSKALLFPKVVRMLKTTGENIRLARKRRHWTTENLAERAGIARGTLAAIEKGSSSVSMGHYAAVLFALGLAEDLKQLGAADPDGRRLQDIDTLSGCKRG